jgi:hypothetical protein
MLSSALNAQNLTIADANFKAQLLASSPFNSIAIDFAGYSIKIDANSDGEIQVTEANQVKQLSFTEVSGNSIVSLAGIGGFTNLEELHCIATHVTTFDATVLPHLKNVDFLSNRLLTINVAGLSGLEALNCYGNFLTSIDFTGLVNLKELNCGSNYFSSLDVSNLSNLTKLDFDSNSINISLNLTTLTNLKELNCNSSHIQSLNVSGLGELQEIHCMYNNLPTFDLGGLYNLRNLYCQQCHITDLNIVGCFSLVNLFCDSNAITSLYLWDNTHLESLGFSNNLMTTIDISHNRELQNLYCQDNQLTTMYLKNMNFESVQFGGNPNLTYICADDNQVAVLQAIAIQNGNTNCTVDSSCVLANEGFAANTIQCYPNPASGILNLKIDGQTNINSIVIYNVLGQQVQNISDPQQHNAIDVSGLKTGNYFIKIDTDKGIINTKFIKI